MLFTYHATGMIWTSASHA